ncbi:MAG: hypothetical protein NTU70_05920 [Methylococcales bacterium]|nr:hypothetical protein [Methylococcales bacterium]
MDKDVWQLFNVTEDFSEANDLASTNPKKLQELQKVFLKEVVKYNVLPIDDRSLERLNPEIAGRPDLMGTRTALTLYDGMDVTEGAGINTKNKSYTITADINLINASAKGVIISQGGRFGGWTLYMKDGIAHHQYNYLGLDRSQVRFS